MVSFSSLNIFIINALEFFFFNFIYLFIYLFIYGCVGSSFLCKDFLQLWQAGATPHRGARASHYHGLSCCGAQVPDTQAQQLWLTGPVSPWHVGSSPTRARTCVPCIGRQILNHCATREALLWSLCLLSVPSEPLKVVSISCFFFFLCVGHTFLFLCMSHTFLLKSGHFW